MARRRVVPPAYQGMTWWASQAIGGRRQPGNAQCLSRAISAQPDPESSPAGAAARRRALRRLPSSVSGSGLRSQASLAHRRRPRARSPVSRIPCPDAGSSGSRRPMVTSTLGLHAVRGGQHLARPGALQVSTRASQVRAPCSRTSRPSTPSSGSAFSRSFAAGAASEASAALITAASSTVPRPRIFTPPRPSSTMDRNRFRCAERSCLSSLRSSRLATPSGSIVSTRASAGDPQLGGVQVRRLRQQQLLGERAQLGVDRSAPGSRRRSPAPARVRPLPTSSAAKVAACSPHRALPVRNSRCPCPRFPAAAAVR